MLSSGTVASRSTSRRDAPTPGQRVRAERVRANLTQEQLAARAKKHVNTIANMEDDSTPPRLTARGWRTVQDVARALGTTPEALGYRLKRRVDAKTLTGAQREVIEEILGLPKADLAAVREMLRELETRRTKGRR